MTVACPIAAVLLAVSIKVLETEAGFRENDAVTPLGRPVTARLTLPVNPYSGFTETFTSLEVPGPMATP